jgi:hypothetical protein
MEREEADGEAEGDGDKEENESCDGAAHSVSVYGQVEFAVNER